MSVRDDQRQHNHNRRSLLLLVVVVADVFRCRFLHLLLICLRFLCFLISSCIFDDLPFAAAIALSGLQLQSPSPPPPPLPYQLIRREE